ncbi:MAG: hypothetical protein IJB26_01465 [Clostridia bacterium]|nr:hypothetical protein [Clostridia bacterium]
MIKGVNRQMIEVTHTGSPYFERAFLVVRSGGSQPSDDLLQRLAQKVVQQADTYAGLRRQRTLVWLQRAAWSFLCGGIGAGVLWLFQTLG